MTTTDTTTPVRPSPTPARPGAFRGAPADPHGYRLLRSRPADRPLPEPDADQRAVADHRGGPLLVLAGPGTGKTTTLVEAVASRVAEGLGGQRMLVLTFSRRAAGELRDRLTRRLGGGALPMATTVHAFAYGLVRAYQDPELFSYPVRLLTGPEQDVVVRDLVSGTIDQQVVHARGGTHSGGVVPWPNHLRAALTTRGFADELRAVIARARELGLDGERLARAAAAAGRPDWFAAARFLEDYVEILDQQGLLDYAELVHRAALLAAEDRVRDDLRRRFAAVFVDEYQDTDPAQVRLLRAFAGDGRDLVVFGDPDQSIYAFRGAHLGNILDFPHIFAQADGAPAPVRVLRRSRRLGPVLLAASRAVTRRMPMPRLDPDAVRQHRELLAGNPSGVPGRVEVLIAPTAGAERDTIADLLRRAHIEDGVAWADMAVLVRSGAQAIAGLRRTLGAAGVPVEVAGDELPIAAEAAVAPLLTALRCAADPTALTAEAARGLLLSPLVGADPTDLRRLGRQLRIEERTAAGPGAEQVGGVKGVRPADELIREAVAEPERLVGIEERIAAPAARLGRMLAAAREALAQGEFVHDTLWRIWSSSPWPQRLERTALRGGPASRAAHRDLDAVCALFDLASRADLRGGGRGVRNFLAELQAQQISGDTLTERSVRGDAVRVLTAHRSKGLEWRLVVVAGVQEGVWPDLRRRGSLLDADRIGPDGLTEPPTTAALLAEERRLFYVAVTRATERLVVTAVREADGDGEQPSRFVQELGVEPVPVQRWAVQPLALSALVAQLRTVLAAPGTSAPMRRAVARRLAALAEERDADGTALVPAADPVNWWGVHPTTDNAVPVRPPQRPVALSGSAAEALAECPLRWFLAREVRADTGSGPAASFGNVIHVIADEVASGDLPAQLPVLFERLDDIWDSLAFDAPWKSVQEKDAARAAVERFLAWHALERHRTLVASELPFEVELGAGDVRVLIRGRFDRVEADRDGVAYIVDFKTGAAVPTKRQVEEHVQLAVYQLVARAGALDGIDVRRSPEDGGGRVGTAVGGAELVQLRHPAAAKVQHLPKVQAQAPPQPDEGGGTWIERLLAEVAGRVLQERFDARPCSRCSMCEYRRCCPGQPTGRSVVE